MTWDGTSPPRSIESRRPWCSSASPPCCTFLARSSGSLRLEIALSLGPHRWETRRPPLASKANPYRAPRAFRPSARARHRLTSRRRAGWVERLAGRSALPQPLAHEHKDDARGIKGGQFLAFFAPACLVGDRHLEHTKSGAQHTGSDFPLDLEPAGAQVERAPHVGCHRLMAGHDVCQPAVEEHVGDQRDRLVPHYVPEAEGRVGGEAAYAEDDVAIAGREWTEELSNVGGVVLEVGVEDRCPSATGMLDCRSHGGPFAAIAVMKDDPHLGAPVVVAEEPSGAVGGAVVDHDQFSRGDRQVGVQRLADGIRNRGALVVDRHQDCQLWHKRATL